MRERGDDSGRNTADWGASESTHYEPSWRHRRPPHHAPQEPWPGHVFFALAHQSLHMRERFLEATYRFYQDLFEHSWGLWSPRRPEYREERETRVEKLWLSGVRGTTLQGRIRLPNPTSRSVRLELRTQSFHKESRDGKLGAGDIDGSERWVEISPSQASVGPRQSVEIALKIDTKPITPGDYQGIITVESTPYTFGRTVILIELRIEDS
jgi:hypothetical protein